MQPQTLLVTQLKLQGIKDARVLKAMSTVAREAFVPTEWQRYAYADSPLPIGYAQTISQPFIVAYMTEALALTGAEKVLEIGTGSGYQAAILAELAQEVYSIELIPALAKQAKASLDSTGVSNVTVKQGDGTLGWPEHQPFDAIIVTAAAESLPLALVAQMKVGGRMILPIGTTSQTLLLLHKTKTDIVKETLIPVRFVPLIPES